MDHTLKRGRKKREMFSEHTVMMKRGLGSVAGGTGRVSTWSAGHGALLGCSVEDRAELLGPVSRAVWISRSRRKLPLSALRHAFSVTGKNRDRLNNDSTEMGTLRGHDPLWFRGISHALSKGS